ncbi:hypothetical protein ACFY7C_17355 [Streptomyces sp. NPDC012769]|uniref:hypothetical protein n=1 Tax=Streptomyces sp. NPDC012769 TaxID=3364848 RepID=UPI003685FFFF
MNDHSTDPALRALFRAAAEHGRHHAAPLPVADVVARGRRSHRRRVALAAAGVTTVMALGALTAVVLVPGRTGPALPATSPSTGSATSSAPGPTPDPTTSRPGPGAQETQSAPPNPPTSTPGTTAPAAGSTAPRR